LGLRYSSERRQVDARIAILGGSIEILHRKLRVSPQLGDESLPVGYGQVFVAT